MTFANLVSLCIIQENREFVGQYELDVNQLQTILDRNGWIKITDRSAGKNPNFRQEFVEPIVAFLKEHGVEVASSLSRHDFSDGYHYYIRPVRELSAPPPELEPWNIAKKKLEKRRIDRGHAHPGASAAQMLRKVSRQKAIGQPLDNTFGYGKKDSKGRPLDLSDSTVRY